MKKILWIVLGAYLILSGLIVLIPSLGELSLAIPILALAAGILIFVRMPSKPSRIGWILAAAFLLIDGLTGLTGLTFKGIEVVVPALALVASLLLLARQSKIKSKLAYVLFFSWLAMIGLMRLANLTGLEIAQSIYTLFVGALLVLEA